MELVFIFRLLYRKKWIIISCALLAMVAAFLLTMNKQRMYKSFAQLSTGFTVSEDIKLSDDIFNIPQIDVKFNNAIENITSPKVLSLLSYNLMIHDLTSETPFRKADPKRAKDIGSDLNFDKNDVVKILRQKSDSMLLLNPGVPREKKLLNLLYSYGYNIETLKKELTVSRYQRTDYININFLSENPNLSAYVVNDLVKEFHAYTQYFRREKTDGSIAEIDSLVRRRKLELDQLVQAKAQFLQDSGILDPGVAMTRAQQVNYYENALADERGRVQNLSFQIQEIERRIRDLQGTGGGASGSVNRTNDEYIILRKQYNDLYGEYVKGGSSDPALLKRLEDIKQKMLQVQFSDGGGAVNDYNDNQGAIGTLAQRKISLEGELKSANVRLSHFQQALGALRGGVGSQGSKQASLDQLNKEIEIATAEYSSAKEKLNTASNMTEVAPYTFRQTVFGQPAYVPESSGRIPIIALSGFSAFVLTCAVFIFMQLFDQSIKTPSSFSRLTGLKLLGVTGWIPLKGHKISDHVVFMEAENVLSDKEGAHKRTNSFRELLRKLRYEIENSGKRIFLFTSTEPRQGKTTLIQALAFSLSLGKKRVLILDTNFCNNDLTVANEAQPNLEKFSGNEADFSFERVRQLITKTNVENVDIIGCQGGDYTPSEVLPQNHLLNYLEALLKEYDYIFMEGAPLNGFTDTKELVQYAEGVIAIFSAHAEIRQPDKESINFLKGLKAKFLGGILNKVDPQHVNF